MAQQEGGDYTPLDTGWEWTIIEYIGDWYGGAWSSVKQLRANGLRYIRNVYGGCVIIDINRITRGDFPLGMLEGKHILVELHKVDELRNLYVYPKKGG